MDNKILKSIIEITQQRDLDSLEYSLVGTLVDIVPAHGISLQKLLNDDNQFELEEVIQLNVKTGPNNENDYEWNYDRNTLETNQYMKQCLDQKASVSYKNNDSLYTLVPVISGRKIAGILSFKSDQDLSEFSPLIDGIARIYGNYLFILNESERDKLTGLFNRRTFDNKLRRMLKMQRDKQKEYTHLTFDGEKRKQNLTSSAWLVLLDIDHFKSVNDTFGHLYGDEVILLISQKMRQCFRKTDLLFRFGGEEFVIVLEPIPDKNAYNVLSKFRQAIADHNFPQIGQVTISIGYTMIREIDYPPTILNLADKALYYAKEHGRNCVHKYETLVNEGKLQDLKKSGNIDLF